MYLPLMAVLFDESAGQGYSVPLIAPGVEVANQMVHKAHPHWLLRGLYDKTVLQQWLVALDARASLPAAPSNGGSVPDPVQRFIAVMMNGPHNECVPVEAANEAEALTVLGERMPSHTLGHLFPRATIEGFLQTLERFESKLLLGTHAH